ncbi:HAD hydrolase-like protein [Endozoicomonas elysicola]|uniref:Hydrolase n=1 Tax=Endozoicomonas elysicola TaxID=305900 RepID=A0A081KAG9_9GAMM|nr:HAD hydrolase-like protein [Endozoicomonas elysicola]KEI71145.1 hypothetical protein GV64_10670 [Endozoicomonas elysicola]
MYKLRTIDVWDTLLRRKGHPDFSKLISARALSLTHKMELAIPFEDYWAIFRERCAVEDELASTTSHCGEYEVNDVLTRLLSRVLINNQDQMDLAVLAGRLAEMELQFELRHTYPDPKFLNFSQEYPAQQSLFLSDFYMSSASLQRLLKHHGLETLVSQGISSCDVRLNKRSGKLFKHVHHQFDITPRDHVHIGDNIHADVEMPKKLGIQTVHYLPEEEHRKRQEQAAFIHDRYALFRHIAEDTKNLATDEAKELEAEAQPAYLLGIHTAPLLVGFILQIAERALLDRVERLYFFTREGEFLLQVWRAIFPNNCLAGQKLPLPDILEVSRIATFCASLREISTEELMRLWNLYSTQSISALLKTLGLKADKFTEVCQSHGLNPKEKLVNPWQDARVQALFKNPLFIEPVRAKINSDRTNLLEYLDQHGWQQNLAKVGIVDIGWRGTIQDNLAYLFPDIHIYGYYLGLQCFLNDQPLNCSKSAFCVDANLSNNYINLLDAVSLIEMLCNSPNGSVSGYIRSVDGSMIASRIIDEDENAVYKTFVTYFQKGVLFTSRSWSDYIDSHVIASRELKESSCKIWHELVAKPSQDVAKAYASLRHNEIFGVGEFINKSAVPSPWQLFHGIFSKKVRQEVILYIRQNQWIAGISSRKDLGLSHRILLTSVLLMGRGYKRFRYWLNYR